MPLTWRWCSQGCATSGIDRRGRRRSMPFRIKDPRIQDLARRLANATGESLTEAVRVAIQERLARIESRRRGGWRLADRLDEIARHWAALPVRRRWSAAQILGYGKRGLPR